MPISIIGQMTIVESVEDVFPTRTVGTRTDVRR
jgi:hypothetical protein